MTTISEAGNTLVPAVLSLQELGWALEITPERVVATKGQTEVVASDPLTALGLVTILLVRGDDWQANDVEIDSWLPLLRP